MQAANGNCEVRQKDYNGKYELLHYGAGKYGSCCIDHTEIGEYYKVNQEEVPKFRETGTPLEVGSVVDAVLK